MTRPPEVRTRADLVDALGRLRRTAARGTRRPQLSLDLIARRTGIPRSTVHSYLTGKTLPPGDALDELLTAIGVPVSDLGRWADALERIIAAEAGSAPRPARRPASTLPRVARDVFGRENDLVRLSDEVEGSASQGPLVLLTGMAGVGKTTLALAWAARNRALHPDGQVLIDLRGYSGTEPLLPAAAITRVLTALGQRPEHLPLTESALIDHYRATLDSRRMLVILDNASDAGQVEQLLVAGPGVTCVVTSRDALSSLVVAHGAARIVVSALDAASSRRWLEASTSDLDPASVNLLVRQCEGLPLALQLVAERLRIDPGHTTLASIVDHPLDALAVPGITIRDTIGWSVDRLTATDREAFATLGVIPGGRFCTEVAAVVLHGHRADTTLRRLARVGLLDEDDDWHRHDLVTALSRELFLRATAEERRATLARLRAYLLGVLRAADPHAMQLDGDPSRATPPADLDIDHAREIVRHAEDVIVGLSLEALSRGEVSFAADAIVMLSVAAEREGSPLRLIPLLVRVLQSAERSSNDDQVFRLSVRLAAVHHQQGRLTDSSLVLERALQRTPRDAPDGRWVELNARLCGNHATLGDTSESIRFLTNALADVETVPFRIATMAWMFAGVHYSTVRDYATADECFAQSSRPDADGRLTPFGYTSLLNRLGDAAYEGRLADARELLALALAQDHSRVSERLRTQTLLMWANLERVEGHHERAIEVLTDALELAERQGDIYHRIRIRIQFGRNQASLGRLVEADENYRQALFLARQHGFGHDELCGGLELADVLLRRREPGMASSLLDQLVGTLEAYGSDEDAAAMARLRERTRASGGE